MRNYLIIFILTIIPSALFFVSNIPQAYSYSSTLFVCGVILAFLHWKRDDEKVQDILKKIF